MAYGLRKIYDDGVHHDFKWTLEVGSTIECPDWNPKPWCGNGLHLLPNAQGDWGLLRGYYWVVIEYDEKDLVMIGSNKGKVPRCKIVEIQDPDNMDPDKLLSYFDISKFDSRSGYYWARYIGNSSAMIDKVVEPEWAYWWGLCIGNRDIMKPRITDPYWIDRWNEWVPGDRIGT